MSEQQIYNALLIDEAMFQQGFTNPGLADETQISQATISKIRNGHPDVRLESLRRVTDRLGISLHKLFAPKAAAQRFGKDQARLKRKRAKAARKRSR